MDWEATCRLVHCARDNWQSVGGEVGGIVDGHAPPPRRLLVVMLADAGDLLLATPALRALRTTYPSAHIMLLTKPTNSIVVAGQGLVDEVVPFDKHLFDEPRALL